MLTKQIAFSAVGLIHSYGQCTFLAAVSFTSGNMADIAMKIICRLPSGASGTRKSFKYESGYTFHFLCDDRFVFVVMEREVGAFASFSLLERMQQKWSSQFGTQPGFAQDTKGCKDFERTIHDLVERTVNSMPLGNSIGARRSDSASGKDSEAEELGAVQDRLEGIKQVMADSIEKVLERGDKIELLVDKTDRLHQQAFKFAR